MSTATPLEEFLELVECDPSAVLDIPPERIDVDHSAFKGKARPKVFVTFGKHKGSMLSEVPAEYLWWIAEQPARTVWFGKFQEQVAEELDQRRRSSRVMPSEV
jgi:uncharacterized protein (DUF3820 family)